MRKQISKSDGLMFIQEITSDDSLENIDHHFRVVAGPGAGKTYWLVNHIKNVVSKSARLFLPCRVACISYTNVAVNEIVERIGSCADRVEVSTIHSFLYRNVVKPYLHFLKDQQGSALVNHVLVDGHEEHIPSYSNVRDWLEAAGQKISHFKSLEKVYAYLRALNWQRDDATGNWGLKLTKWMQPVPYLPTTKLHLYKPFYWQQGIIDHSDVLYFAYRILEEFPIIQSFLSARFPYLFIDEFQDTNPIQTQVVRWLANKGTLIGIIGDAEQSIYSFQGARYEDFKHPQHLPIQAHYQISNNRRSTDRIIEFLNHLRADGLQQIGLRGIEGENVCIYIGDIEAAVSKIRELLSSKDVLVILTRKNDEAARIRRMDNSDGEGLWQELESIDSNRRWLLEHTMAALESARLQNYSYAIRTMIQGIRLRNGVLRDPFKLGRSITDIERRGLAVCILEKLLSQYEVISSGSVLNLYKEINKAASQAISGLLLVDIKGGKIKSFTESKTYQSLASSISLNEELRYIRTIHQAKGTEFESVLVWFADKKNLDHLLYPTKKTEDHRITYVALSRARDRLFIAIPEASPQDEDQLRSLNLETIRIS